MTVVAGTRRAPTFQLATRRKVTGLPFGSLASARRGSGSDVAGSRPYVPGDDIDHIDWHASARLSSARGTDEFIVWERFAEEAPRVLVVCDRRPAMALYPPPLPWLSKPAALQTAAALIAESAFAARGLAGYLDYAERDPDGRPAPFWSPPRGRADLWRTDDGPLGRGDFDAPEDNVSLALEYISRIRRDLPGGTFVFVVSDFFAGPPEPVWARALERGWEVVPVIVRDPVWEQSFPDVAGVLVPLVDPSTGEVARIRMSRSRARARATDNERSLADLLAMFERLPLDPVLVSSSTQGEVLEAFLGWAAARQAVQGRAW